MSMSTPQPDVTDRRLYFESEDEQVHVAESSLSIFNNIIDGNL